MPRRPASRIPSAAWVSGCSPKHELERLLLRSTGWQRFTQDSPIFADVWLAYLGNQPSSGRTSCWSRTTVRPPAPRAGGSRAAPMAVHRSRARVCGRLRGRRAHPARAARARCCRCRRWWRDADPAARRLGVRPSRGVRARASRSRRTRPATRRRSRRRRTSWCGCCTVAGRLLTDTVRRRGGRAGSSTTRELSRARSARAPGPPRTIALQPIWPLWSVSRNREVRGDAVALARDGQGRRREPRVPRRHRGPRVGGRRLRHRRPASGVPEPRRRRQLRCAARASDFDDDDDRPRDLRLHQAARQRSPRRLARTSARGRGAGARRRRRPSQRRAASGARDRLGRLRAADPDHARLGRLRATPPGDAHGTHVAGTIAGDWRPDDPRADAAARAAGRLPRADAVRPPRPRRQRRPATSSASSPRCRSCAGATRRAAAP